MHVAVKCWTWLPVCDCTEAALLGMVELLLLGMVVEL